MQVLFIIPAKFGNLTNISYHIAVFLYTMRRGIGSPKNCKADFCILRNKSKYNGNIIHCKVVKQ